MWSSSLILILIINNYKKVNILYHYFTVSQLFTVETNKKKCLIFWNINHKFNSFLFSPIKKISIFSIIFNYIRKESEGLCSCVISWWSMVNSSYNFLNCKKLSFSHHMRTLQRWSNPFSFMESRKPFPFYQK